MVKGFIILRKHNSIRNEIYETKRYFNNYI